MEHTCQNQHENETIAERLLIVRRRTGLSQGDFAKKIGVIPRSYRNYEAAVRDVPLALAVAVHRVFNVDLTWLVLGERAAVTLPPPAVFEKVLSAVDEFEKKRSISFGPEKKAKQINYLIGQFANGRDMSVSDIHDYLETTI
ncbi:helix-turn-helix transcriptional regulator [Paracoccus pantotrophus]|uniref:Helix-turn-helix transcriptional regulator n=1 Tax=Paracoccus pantotrophus TaxID=82367 RepID=A0A7H9BW95_PARPN|nr:helix-turn-helix transcriptional regulator [Paracoccus pantotrophus]QLH15289.1 helix-turn-helix transcriptional regulator [Paracoccus pantotrophus]